MIVPTSNRERLVQYLMEEGPSYRANLARILDLSRTTVTNLVNRLLEQGYIDEVNPGLPNSVKNPLSLNTKLGVLAAVVHCSNCIYVLLTRADGHRLFSREAALDPSTSGTARLNFMADLLSQCLGDAQLSSSKLLGIYLAIDTQMDHKSGEIYRPTARQIWGRANPQRSFTERFRTRIFTQNTDRLKGLTECIYGAGSGYRDIAFVHVGKSIVLGHVVDNRVLVGAHGGSGELGHSIFCWDGPECECGNRGCLQQFASTSALERRASKKSGRPRSFAHLIEDVHLGHEYALQLYSETAEILGRYLGGLCHVIDPDMLILSGPVVGLHPNFVSDVHRYIRQVYRPQIADSLEVKAAQLRWSLADLARAGIDQIRRCPDMQLAMLKRLES